MAWPSWINSLPVLLILTVVLESATYREFQLNVDSIWVFQFI